MGAPGRLDLVDRVDEHDRVVGTIARGDVFHQHAAFRTIHVMVHDRRGNWLLQRVGLRRGRNPGLWGSSVAGYIFAGETPLAAAIRRMREEIGLDVPLVGCGSSRMKDETATKFVHVFVATAERADNLDPEHIEELRFWADEQIVTALAKDPDAFTPTFRVVLERVRSHSADT